MKLQRPDLAGKTAKCPACDESFVIKLLNPAGNGAAKPATTAAPSQKPAQPKPAAAKTAPQKPAQQKPASPQPTKAAAAKQDVDFPLDEVEILDAEEITDDAASADEDWLTALDSLAPKGPNTGKAATTSAAPVVRGRTKKPKESDKPRKRQWRDADGEFPLWMSRLFMIGTGAGAGGLCVIFWAATVARLGVQIDWFAIFVGGIVGGGVRLGASKWDFGWFPAITAAVIALVAIIGGKVYGVHTLRKEAAREEMREVEKTIAMMKHGNYPIHLTALEIIEENEAAGIDEIPFYELSTDPRRLPQTHGQERWEAATARWEGKTDAEKAAIRAMIAEDIEAASNYQPEPLAVNEHTLVVRGVPIHFEEGSRTQVLSVLDFVFAAIALVVAFRIAIGIHGEGD
ncbi:MAG: hypothetical protein JNG89_16055 [Planctomycetaceae bacterium]|nr:hypothetical protein [Planctomycetaceae bacterium]